ncbi:TlpA disulfide reductase family protein [Pseudoteredinibacter isoporae]|uniref:TlpA disulfide reductase family protein n=1 Tax=Pseudoteredinibacter isoporae TaxID=570281 RepID=UPI00310391EC
MTLSNRWVGLSKGKRLALVVWVTAILVACSGDRHIELADGGELRLDAQQVLVINYWAKWCKPCLHEIPELNRLNKNTGITVIGIDFDKHQGQELNSLIAQMKIEFPVLAGQHEPKHIHPELTRKAQALPMTYLMLVPSPESGKGIRLSKALLGPQTEDGLLGKIKQFQGQ